MKTLLFQGRYFVIKNWVVKYWWERCDSFWTAILTILILEQQAFIWNLRRIRRWLIISDFFKKLFKLWFVFCNLHKPKTTWLLLHRTWQDQRLSRYNRNNQAIVKLPTVDTSWYILRYTSNSQVLLLAHLVWQVLFSKFPFKLYSFHIRLVCPMVE